MQLQWCEGSHCLLEHDGNYSHIRYEQHLCHEYRAGLEGGGLIQRGGGGGGGGVI